jgi:hypothetical protein
MGRIERAPSWILKYKERIERGEITVERILDVENEGREVPIKISSVTRAINAMGHPITGLRRGYMEAAAGATAGEREENTKESEEPERRARGASWMQKYREQIEKGTITVEEILEAENRIRAVPIKLITVTRAINTMGYPITGLRRGKKEEVEKLKKAGGAAEAVVYSLSIDKISGETEKRFIAIKKSWEKDLGKSLPNDYFVNILLALAKLVEHGKTLAPAAQK